MLSLTKNKGIYLLEIKAEHKFSVEHIKFDHVKLKKGYYYYVGSAQKNLSQRINRHFTKVKNKYWHIDYLIINKNIVLISALIFENFQKSFECDLVEKLIVSYSLQEPLKNFGNSDCKRCNTHLLYSSKRIDYNHLCSLYQSTVLFIPSSKDIFWE